MTFVGNIGGGMAVSFSIIMILAVANTLFTYVSPTKSTLQEAIDSKTGLGTSAVV
jgi:hypothetical protein|tara:strand:- start:2805 stop:2969 length:165 start_codon:yes stop_codon:yes gene_type:complete